MHRYKGEFETFNGYYIILHVIAAAAIIDDRCAANNMRMRALKNGTRHGDDRALGFSLQYYIQSIVTPHLDIAKYENESAQHSV